MSNELFLGIQQSKSLKTLSLYYYFELLGLEMISTNSTLTSLKLTHLHMNKEEAIALKQALIENTTLKEMQLFCIESLEIAELVAEGLQYNTGITELILESTEGVGTLLQTLTNNSTLTSFKLITNYEIEMDKEGAMALKRVLIKNTTLREMTFSIVHDIINVQKAYACSHIAYLLKYSLFYYETW